ncbi:helix-turn-helix domain-containing protein [Roseicyclus sp. F158]|uniref:Helix-turn-helix domain-containing protein n=1 Tax=Tropicimonas omnivorans TaxID=3075590 RepID=A0ABU3DKR0_9RHOB|nr:helix-turn-helix domain-containing protein [Roseicyclus sp. F158]MDT0684301.1 helix-turn-helix domain-containing protein [Roseicyclus sp. F158]
MSIKRHVRPGRPTADEAERIGEAVLLEARSLFVANGYDRTSMDQLAARSGVSKRTIYTRFESKADLFSTVVRQLGDATLTALESTEVPEGTPFEVLHALGAELTAFARDRDIIAMERMTMDMARDLPELLKIRREQSRRIIAVVVHRLTHILVSPSMTPEQLERDASIFLSLTLIPTLHLAMTNQSGEPAASEDHLSRAVQIFVDGYL